VITIVAAGGGALVPQAAGASVTPRVSQNLTAPAAGCPSSTFCLYGGVSYSGTQWDYAYSSHNHNTWLSVGSGANDQAASLQNSRAWTTKVGQNYPESGGYRCYDGNTQVADLSQISYVNDTTHLYHTISSYDLKTSTVSSCTGGA
jgi:hypothetical protein